MKQADKPRLCLHLRGTAAKTRNPLPFFSSFLTQRDASLRGQIRQLLSFTDLCLLGCHLSLVHINLYSELLIITVRWAVIYLPHEKLTASLICVPELSRLRLMNRGAEISTTRGRRTLPLVPVKNAEHKTQFYTDFCTFLS